MAEAVIFLLVAGFVTIGIFVTFGITNVDPRWIVGAVAVALLPGFYAAVTSGPFVPSARKRHRHMMELADLRRGDVVYDLGCGDGRLVFQAAGHVKKAVGYELSVPLWLFGNIKRFFSRNKGHIRYGNIWKQDYSDATVIFCYLLPNAMKQFYKEVWPNLKPGTRVISNAFQMHEIKPIRELEKVYLYKAK